MMTWNARRHWINLNFDDVWQDFCAVYGEAPDEDEQWTLRLVATNEFDGSITEPLEST